MFLFFGGQSIETFTSDQRSCFDICLLSPPFSHPHLKSLLPPSTLGFLVPIARVKNISLPLLNWKMTNQVEHILKCSRNQRIFSTNIYLSLQFFFDLKVLYYYFLKIRHLMLYVLISSREIHNISHFMNIDNIAILKIRLLFEYRLI